MLLMIDNYDSFTYNLVQYFRELGEEVEVYRNDTITVEEIARRQPRQLVISPGPLYSDRGGDLGRGDPGNLPAKCRFSASASGISRSARLSAAGSSAPARLMHGKTSPILHDGSGIFPGSLPILSTRPAIIR